MGHGSPVLLHRCLVRFYPGAFRRLYGDQILVFWTTQRREPRYATPLFGGLRYWIEVLRDALGNHTFPPDVYALAQEAGARALVLSHLVPPLPAAQAERPYAIGRDAFSGESWIG